jgi:hypothetical protein
MKASAVVEKVEDTKKEFSPTKKSDSSIHHARNEPERQLGSLRDVIDSIRHNGGTPSADSIATELSSMHTAERAPMLLALQRTHGNRYVQRVVAGIQAKLKVGQPGDIYEQEADRVAELVMRMPEPVVQQPEEEEEELIMAKWISGKVPAVTYDLEPLLNRSKGGGHPLTEQTRSFMENRFGMDFSQVKVHTDSHAVEMARALNAEAFTSGQDVYFAAGKYNLDSVQGKRLIAHELTHVIQQGGAVRQTKNRGYKNRPSIVRSPVPQIQRWVLPSDWLDYIGLAVDVAERIYIELAYEEGQEKDFRRFVNNLYFVIDIVLAALPIVGGGGLAIRGSHAAAVAAWRILAIRERMQVIVRLSQLMGWTIAETNRRVNLFMSASQQRGGTPRSREAQNRQFNDAVRESERRIGRRLSADERQRLHREISGQDFGYHEIVETAVNMFRR